MKTYIAYLVFTFCIHTAHTQWPMSNDSTFNIHVSDPVYGKGQGPRILLDGGHHNFFIQWDFINPFVGLAREDGYECIIDSLAFTPGYLERFDIVMIITALPFDFTTKTEVTTEHTFTEEEINHLHEWVHNGGSLLVFSEHAPFDQAIKPLLEKFDLKTSIGVTIDTVHYNRSIGGKGWIEYTTENGGLDMEHPIIQGRSANERINKVMSFGGSALSGEKYTRLFKLTDSSRNIMHHTGVGPQGRGNAQCLAGTVGRGKLVALGDSNGFTAMNFKKDDGTILAAGMHMKEYDWKQFVLNTLHWLSGDLE